VNVIHCNQLTSKVDGGITGSRLRWSILQCVTPQYGNRVSISLGNSGLCWTVFARNRDTAVPAEGNGDLQTLICVLVARPRRCLTLSMSPDKTEWRLISATLCGWRRCFVADQLWLMKRIREEEEEDCTYAFKMLKWPKLYADVLFKRNPWKKLHRKPQNYYTTITVHCAHCMDLHCLD